MDETEHGFGSEYAFIYSDIILLPHIQREIVTTAIPEKSTSRYNLRSKRDEEMDIAGTDNGLNSSSTKGVMNPEDDEMMLDNDADDKSLDDVATPRARHDSDSTVIYDLDDPLERSNRPTLGHLDAFAWTQA